MKKLWFLYICIIISFLIIIIRLFTIQVLRLDNIKEVNYISTVTLLSDRGRIYDSNNQPIGLNKTEYLLYAEPPKIKNLKEVISTIDSIFSLGESTIEAIFKENNKKVWIPVIDAVNLKDKEKIEELKIEGIGFEKKSSRYYPESSLSAHLIGFVGKNTKGESVGYYGLEGYYEMDLKGIPGISRSEVDPLGRPIFIGTQDRISPVNGRDLFLSIDIHIQAKSKELLKDGIYKYGAKGGCIIVADPMSMNIISLVCLPDYDPSEYYKFGESFFSDKAIVDLFEPGSIFKPLIMASALNENKVKPSDIYNETGPIKIGEYSIKTWDNKYSGKITMSNIIEKSSNVGMVYIGEKLGKDLLIKYLNNFGFGQKTGIDLEGEASGYIKRKNEWYPIDYATATFGQGIVVTPIQMIRAFASVINGGYLLQPRVVKTFSEENKKNIEVSKTVIRRVIKEESSVQIKKMLESTIKNGEVEWDVPKGYRFGGKTGTAQIPIGGTYDPSKTNASFIGFFPVDKPRFIAMIILKEPSTSTWASETVAPMFFDLARELILYYNIAPDNYN